MSRRHFASELLPSDRATMAGVTPPMRVALVVSGEAAAVRGIYETVHLPATARHILESAVEKPLAIIAG